eukprot:CAMPEP_0206052278 /NCGR_PEP_ID=MMETSP1466-20131121/33407_1 /ASSEMBLY_ACC=CAM_ASM_001126 /TAXON_ID=44452 /ORGANISM="Pavlova gyrans, Strain CCMP608" /LENGTH=248 /DNA_ID=CAMNT_0053427429 /DNA_START=8 /DNA_END=751 /DNA_ORIENTATION=+
MTGAIVAESTYISDLRYAPFYLTGAALTLFSTSFVIATYLSFPKLRKHPSPLLFWMSVCDFGFALLFLVEFSVERSLCLFLSPITQMFIFASELFFAMHGVDLVYGLTHPFTLDRANMRKYHVVVWVSSVATGIVIPVYGASGQVGIGLCWIREGLPALYVGLLVPVGCAYVLSIAVLLWAARRLRRGMPATFKTRLRVLYKLRTTVAICSLYMLVLIAAVVAGLAQRARGSDTYASDAATALIVSAR